MTTIILTNSNMLLVAIRLFLFFMESLIDIFLMLFFSKYDFSCRANRCYNECQHTHAQHK